MKEKDWKLFSDSMYMPSSLQNTQALFFKPGDCQFEAKTPQKKGFFENQLILTKESRKIESFTRRTVTKNLPCLKLDDYGVAASFKPEIEHIYLLWDK